MARPRRVKIGAILIILLSHANPALEGDNDNTVYQTLGDQLIGCWTRVCGWDEEFHVEYLGDDEVAGVIDDIYSALTSATTPTTTDLETLSSDLATALAIA